MSKLMQTSKAITEHLKEIPKLHDDLTELARRWKNTVFSWGNDLGKVKTCAYHECADELLRLLESKNRDSR
jgi:hypothetical protein